jgi:hypothetical protein
LATLMRLLVPKDLGDELLRHQLPGIAVERVAASTHDLKLGVEAALVLAVLGDIAVNAAGNLLANWLWGYMTRRPAMSEVTLTIEHRDGSTEVTVRRSGAAGQLPSRVRIELS